MNIESMEIGDARIDATTDVPANAASVLVIVQGSSARPSRRTRQLAQAARAVGAGVATVQLLTAREAATPGARFDVGRLGHRLGGALDGLRARSLGELPIVVCATGTGAAAALVAARTQPAALRGIMSAAGRPELARPVLRDVRASVLLVVGGTDLNGVRASCEALRYLPPSAQLALVPGGSAALDSEDEQYAVAHLLAVWLSSLFVEPR